VHSAGQLVLFTELIYVCRYGQALITFSRLDSPLVSSQLDFWHQTLKRLRLKRADKYNQLFAAMFVELCLKLNRLDMLAANQHAICMMKIEEVPDQKRVLMQAVADAKLRGFLSSFPEIQQNLDNVLF